MTSNNELRGSVKKLLLLLSSRQQQQQFQQQSPSANVALELLCRWFNELYNPGSALFKNTFSTSEYDSIQDFNRYYSLVKGKLPETIEQLFEDENWNSMMHEAKNLLDKISEI